MFKRFIREYKELRYLAYHDSLTGLLNRNWLYKNIGKITSKYVYFIDINNLHNINKLGHTFGDSHINKCIKSIKISNDDILIRYAGDEFVLFSNSSNIIKTNSLFSVGFCKVDGDINKSIKKADKKNA